MTEGDVVKVRALVVANVGLQERVPRHTVLVVLPWAVNEVLLRVVDNVDLAAGVLEEDVLLARNPNKIMYLEAQETRWDGRDGVILVRHEGDRGLHER